jgi:hypothetical protein
MKIQILGLALIVATVYMKQWEITIFVVITLAGIIANNLKHMK